MAGVTVILADDHPVFRDGLVQLLERGGIVVLAAVEDGRAALEAIRTHRPELKVLYDWSGGLVWLALPPSVDADHAMVRAAISATGGHATLIRAPEAVRAAVPVFQPQSPALAALAQRVKESFDPKALFNPGRMG